MAFRRGQWIAAVVLWVSAGAAAQPAVSAAPPAVANPVNPVVLADEVPAEPALVAPVQGEASPTDGSGTNSPAEIDPERKPLYRSPQETNRISGTPTDNKPGSPGGWWTTVGAMTLVLGLIFGLRFALRKLAPAASVGSGQSRLVEVLSRTPVGPKQQVLLLRVADRLLLVGAGSDGMSTLAEITDPEQMADLIGAAERAKANSLSNSFASALRSLRGKADRDAADLEMGDMSVERPITPADGALTQVRGMLDRLRGGGRGA
jgi:flagellar biosynthetic protein FliO